MKTCIATIPTLNICIKAQNALMNEGYYCKIVSIDPRLTRRGCAYGIEFSCNDEGNVRRVLRHAGVSVSQYITNGEGRLV